MYWKVTNRADPLAAAIADRHYSRQSHGSRQFVPPGKCVVLRTQLYDALWVTHYPKAEYVKHAYGGAWICSIFRNESQILSSILIKDALRTTLTIWPDVPSLGIVTFVDSNAVRPKVNLGYCFIKAGFQYVERTKGGLIALWLSAEKIRSV